MSYAVYGLLAGSIYGLWAISFSLIFRATNIFHVMHAAVFTAAAYAFWRLQGPLGFVALPAALMIGVAIGVASEFLLYRPLRKLGVPSILMFVSSLGGYIIVENIIQLVWRADSRMVVPPRALETFVSILGAGGSLLEIVEAGIAVSLLIITILLLRFTMTGKAVRAIAIAPDMAELAGIDVDRIRTIVFAYGSLLISVAGILMVLKTGVEPTSGLHVWVIAVIASLIGRGEIFASFLAAVGVGLTEAVMLIWISASWQPAVPIFVLAVYLVTLAANARVSAGRAQHAARRKLGDAHLRI